MTPTVHMSHMLSGPLMAVHAQPLPLVLAIVAATFFLEDVAVVTVGLLASRMIIASPLALAALLAGTILGDVALYAVARWAGRFRWVRRVLDGEKAQPVLRWLRRRALLITAAARFMPGFRLPVYLAAGALPVPAGRFTAVVALSALVWTPALFLLASRLGEGGVERYGAWGWAFAAALILAAWLAPGLVNGAVGRLTRPARPGGLSA